MQVLGLESYRLRIKSRPVLSWFINPMNTIFSLDLSHKYPSYWSYVHQQTDLQFLPQHLPPFSEGRRLDSAPTALSGQVLIDPNGHLCAVADDTGAVHLSLSNRRTSGPLGPLWWMSSGKEKDRLDWRWCHPSDVRCYMDHISEDIS